MRTLYWSALFLLLVAPPASAQDPEYGPHPWSMQFQVTENFTLSEFQGSVVSVKHHRSDHSAWRAGLAMDFWSGTQDATRTEPGNPDEVQTRDDSTNALTLNLQYLRYAGSPSRMRVFIGGGPYAGFSFRENETSQDGTFSNRFEEDAWRFGLSGVVGVEWFVTSNLGLHAEYGVEFGATSSERTQTGPGDVVQKFETDTLRFADRGVLLGLSAYF